LGRGLGDDLFEGGFGLSTAVVAEIDTSRIERVVDVVVEGYNPEYGRTAIA
jgi:hypothetical protein